MNKFTFALYLASIVILLASGCIGCTVRTYLMNAPEPSAEKEIRQALGSWNGMHISQTIQKWGSPHDIIGEEVGPKIYIWQMIGQPPLLEQEYQRLSLEHTNGPPSRSDTFSSSNVLYEQSRGYTTSQPGVPFSPSNVLYEIVLYTRSNGIIHKTDTRRHQNPINESDWKEKHISKAIQEWGTPHGVTEDEMGSKIYIYQIPVVEFPPRGYPRVLSRQSQTNGLHNVTGTPGAIDDTYEVTFYTRPTGVIYKTLTKRELNSSINSRSLRFSQEQPGSRK